MSRRRLLIYLIPTGVFIVACYGAYYYLTTTPLSVDFTSVSQVEVLEKTSQKKIATLDSNTSSTRIKKGSQFTLHYAGKGDFANGNLNVKSSDAMPIKIKPYYSEKKLASLLDDQHDSITAAISSFLSTNSTVYSVKDLKLYHYGDWCGVVLKYNGEYNLQSDDVRFILNKKSDAWTPVTAAAISLGGPDYPEIPFDILSTTNNL